MPVSNILSSVDCSSSVGAVGDRPAFLRDHRAIGEVDRLAEQFSTRPSVSARRASKWAALIGCRHAALQPVGRLHRHRAHALLAEVLLDFDDDVDRVLGAALLARAAGRAGDADAL
jgi:hypothetical protein